MIYISYTNCTEYIKVSYSIGDTQIHPIGQSAFQIVVYIPSLSTHTIFWTFWHIRKCMDQINTLCYFPNMRNKIRQVIKSCILCQKTKYSNQTTQNELHPIVPTKPLQLVSMDVSGPHPQARGGMKYLIAIYDVFSKFIFLFTMRRISAKQMTKRLLNDYILKIGKPTAMLTDNATYFTSPVWRDFLKEHNIKHILISRFHPQANPVERIFKEFNRFIRTYAPTQQTKWVEYVKPFQEVYNNLIHTSTGFSPNDLLSNRTHSNEWNAPIPKIISENTSLDNRLCQALINLNLEANRRKALFDKRLGRTTYFSEGEKILLRTHPHSNKLKKLNRKWQLLYTGPYIILAIPHPGTYLLAYPTSGKVKGLYPHQHLKKYTPPV